MAQNSIVYSKLNLFVVCLCLTTTAGVEIVRLSDEVFPARYQVTLIPIIEENARLCGHVWIDLDVKKPTDQVLLHALNLTIVRVTFTKLHENSIRSEFEEIGDLVENMCFVTGIQEESMFSPKNDDLVDSFFLDAQSQLVTIKSKEKLVSENSYRIGILYMGDIQDEEKTAFFRINYSRETDDDCCWIGATQLEATQARRVFPCFDEPTFKSRFQLSVGHSTKYKALSNMPLLTSSNFKTTDKWVWSTFAETPPMATYLVACVVTDLDYIEAVYQSISGRNVTIRLWSHSYKLSQLDFPKQLLLKALSRFERHIRMPYPLSKLDLVAIPNYASSRAMENWGLILQSESSLLVTDSEGTVNAMDKLILAITIVHEIAHQWFGNLVTWYWWDDVWVNEGLATFYENIILHEVAEEVNPDMIVALSVQQCLANDVVGRVVPLNAPVEIFAAIEDIFNGLVYIKGAALFRMMRSFLGYEAFQTAINRYLHRHQFKNANSTELMNFFNQEARRFYAISDRMNVAKIMKSWTSQSGFPLITVTRHLNGTIHINQSAFYGNQLVDKEGESKSWWVPLTMVTAEQNSFLLQDRKFISWLTPNKLWVELEGPKSNLSWIIVNPEQSGYYRVNYDEWSWRLISQQLMSDFTVFPPLTRAQLIDDAYTLGHAKILTYEVVLQLIEYMAYVNEIDFVRNAAFFHLSLLSESFATNEAISNKDELRDVLIKMKSILTDSKNSLARPKTQLTLHLMFQDGPCKLDEQICISEALRLFRSEIDSSTSPNEQSLLSDYRESIWCTALRDGGQEEWEYAWKKSNRADVDPKERKVVISSMACSNHPRRVIQLLSRMFHPVINQKPKETSFIIKQLSRNYSARRIVVKFVFRNLNFLLKHFKKFEFSEVVTSIVKQFDTNEEKKQFKLQVIERSSELGTDAVKAILDSLDKISKFTFRGTFKYFVEHIGSEVLF